MSPTRREFVAGAIAAGAASQIRRAAEAAERLAPGAAPAVKDEITIAELQDLMRGGNVDAAGIANEYVARIRRRTRRCTR